MALLQDPHGRVFQYLRLSVTEQCNFRCRYCLPNGYKKSQDYAEPLSVNEIRRLVAGFARLGFWKIRLTGGEPTVRRDLLEIISSIAAIPEIKRIGLSTNGTRLAQNAASYRAAGITALNVSLDSLNSECFSQITSKNILKEVRDGVEAALGLGFESVKVNAVLMKGANDEGVESFLDWIKTRPLTVRFIELMKTGENHDFFMEKHITMSSLRANLIENGWTLASRIEGDGPAQVMTHKDYLGRIGLIAPYSKDFCASCNRLRVSSVGGLRLCLFGESDFSLRSYLQSDEQIDELVAAVQSLIERKPLAHFLHDGLYGNTKNLAAIGG